MLATVKGTVSQFTVSQWIYASSFGLGNQIQSVNFGGATLSAAYISPAPAFRFVGGSVFAASAPFGSYNTSNWVGSWNLFTAVEDNATAYVYINGALIATTTRSTAGASITNPQLQIGNIYAPRGYYDLIGLTDNVRVYNRALSAAEIQALYVAKQ
jgi:hypothetical protein